MIAIFCKNFRIICDPDMPYYGGAYVSNHRRFLVGCIDSLTGDRVPVKAIQEEILDAKKRLDDLKKRIAASKESMKDQKRVQRKFDEALLNAFRDDTDVDMSPFYTEADEKDDLRMCSDLEEAIRIWGTFVSFAQEKKRKFVRIQSESDGRKEWLLEGEVHWSDDEDN